MHNWANGPSTLGVKGNCDGRPHVFEGIAHGPTGEPYVDVVEVWE